MLKLDGLSQKQVDEKIEKYGKNIIKRDKKISSIKIFINQFISPLILILVVASVFSFFVNYYNNDGYFDSILILIIVFISGISGFIQDYKAEKAVEALKKMTTPNARVIRNKEQIYVKTSFIVPGDIVVLNSGDIVPADSRVIKGKLEIDESVLTGESKSIQKINNDKVYSGCNIFSGNAIVEVYATGMDTKIGKIAGRMQNIKDEKTQFQKHIDKLSNKLVIFTGLIVLMTFFIGLRKFGVFEAGLIAISLAVAAIPEGLPAVITLTLSLGAKRMVKKNALIRKLTITESVGSINIICTDKTGTLTEGNMTVVGIWNAYKNKISQKLINQCLIYCNNAKKVVKNKEKKWIGDETEIALKRYALKFEKIKGEKEGEISFTSNRKMMTILQKFGKNEQIFSKGAPEVLINKCSKIVTANGESILSKKNKEDILKRNKKLASSGYRVLALAYKNGKILNEQNLVFLGFVYLNDPVRSNVKNSINTCHMAGIRTIMITGDNPLTAKSVADSIGIKTNNIYTGDDLNKMEDFELYDILYEQNNVFARTSPFHKLKILEILQKQKNIVAMTGDGVNDALALKKADVGIAMGIKGTEVSKQASDIILLDDNFETIESAIREGRRIFNNIKKFVNYLITCNLAEVIVILIATISLPFVALFPVHILWINLITDGLVALSLSADPASKNIMKKRPRKINEGIIDKKLGVLIVFIGIKNSILLLFVLFISIQIVDIEYTRTILFTSFVCSEFVRIIIIKYNEGLTTMREWFANKFLNYSLIISFGLQLIIIYTPLSSYFSIIRMGLLGWLIVLTILAFSFIFGVIITKVVNRIYKEV